MSEEIGNTIAEGAQNEFFISVFDYRSETLQFMESNQLQGGGATWMGLITAALEIESPVTLSAINFDDESDEVVVSSASKAALTVVQSYVSLLMSDRFFMEQCIERGNQNGYLE
ncbi:MAG: Imm51 family immunity protein [Pseudomonadales bacterium]